MQWLSYAARRCVKPGLDILPAAPAQSGVPMPLPDWLEPMAATLTAERFMDSAWTYERKLDGIRMLAFKDGSRVQLYSRNRLPLTAAYPAVAEAVARLPLADAVLDGEATGAWGRQGRADYHVFDVLWLNGQDVRPLPLEARRALLQDIPFTLPVARVKPLSGPEPWTRACREGWEGVIAKRLDSPYESRRSKQWLKMKCEASQELVIGGFTDPRGRRVGLGALLVGYFEGRDFVFAGKVGTGFDTALLRSLRERLDGLLIDRPPFTTGTGLPKSAAHWVRPEVVVQVAFTEWTGHGKLRHPRLLGLRIDKPARDVVRERP
jgi:DNA ligase D-like protein (predicted ligase)